MSSKDFRASGSARNRERDDEEGEDRQPEEAMEQNPDQAGKDDDKAWILISWMITKLKKNC